MLVDKRLTLIPHSQSRPLSTTLEISSFDLPPRSWDPNDSMASLSMHADCVSKSREISANDLKIKVAST